MLKLGELGVLLVSTPSKDLLWVRVGVGLVALPLVEMLEAGMLRDDPQLL